MMSELNELEMYERDEAERRAARREKAQRDSYMKDALRRLDLIRGLASKVLAGEMDERAGMWQVIGMTDHDPEDFIGACDPSWEPIETAPKKQGVLVFYANSNGKGRISKAGYFSPPLHQDCEPFEGCTPNGEVDASGYCDEWLCPPGWYEVPPWQDDEGRYWKINEQITHWMPLPKPPAAHAAKLKEQL